MTLLLLTEDVVRNLSADIDKEKNMESYKREFIEFLESAGVLKFGDFTAKSGRKIPYFINAGEIKTGEQIKTLGQFYAKAYFEKIGNKKTVLYGPAYKGIPIAVSVSVALADKGLDVPFFFNRKEEKDHGEGGVFVGYKPQNGEEIVIVEDVITAGTAIRESMSILSKLEDTKVAATFVMVDRKEKGQGEKSAMAEVGEEYGFPVYSVVDVYDIIEYLEEDEKNAENVQRIKDYLAVNGAKD
ncbi:orotate phosphoribosyltransferase [uncultured Eubacterium sp.]|uniref:orotate phosphoribosyltransferase n=1 Tax=uncultured Eubacterium sp. TaxID=165185 RepID=UPI0025F482EB|nr:orotate phosphoribosyltransferase [uncultured Eubacterium sp.]